MVTGDSKWFNDPLRKEGDPAKRAAIAKQANDKLVLLRRCAATEPS
jgi:hypothetical protein